jgi:hypothetical protein
LGNGWIIIYINNIDVIENRKILGEIIYGNSKWLRFRGSAKRGS